jgi:hypothetical protein
MKIATDDRGSGVIAVAPRRAMFNVDCDLHL